MVRRILIYGLICVVVAVGAVALIEFGGQNPLTPPSSGVVDEAMKLPHPAFLGKRLATLEEPIEAQITADLPAMDALQAKHTWSADQGPLIPHGQGAMTGAEAAEAYLEYRLRAVKAYRAGTSDPQAARAPAIAFLDAYSRGAATQKGDFKAIAALGDAAIKAGSVDPLVRVFHARVSESMETMKPAQSAEVFSEVKEQLTDGAYPPPVLRFLVWAYLAELAERNVLAGIPSLTMRQIAYEEAARFLAKESGSADPDVLLTLVKNTLGFDREAADQRLELYQACLMEPKIDPYIIHLLGGDYYAKLAWQHRGGGFADTVSGEGWSKFRELMPRAARHFRRAWFLHPEHPHAAEEMIMLSTAGGDETWSPEQWFHAAVAAQFDYHDAYYRYMFVTMPRWGGSHQAIADFAEKCIATGRWDTVVPSEAQTAVELIALDNETNDPAGKNPTAVKIAGAYLDAFAAAMKRGEVKPENFAKPLALMTSLLVQAGDYRKARDAFDIGPEANDRWWSIDRGVGYRYSMGLSYAITGPAEKIVAPIHDFLTREATEAPEVADVEEMQKRLEECRAMDMDSRAAGYYDIAGRMLEQLKTYAAGDWVNLTFDPQMTLWTARAAKYDLIDPATLRLTATHSGSSMQLKPLTRFAPPYMVEAEIKPVRALQGDVQAGIVIGARAAMRLGQSPLPQQLSSGPTMIAIFFDRTLIGLPGAVDFIPDPQPVDGFQHLGIRRYPGETHMYAMHGLVVADRQPSQPLNDFIVFGDSNRTGVTGEAVFRNLRIRKAPPITAGLNSESPRSLPALRQGVEYYPECPEARKQLAGALAEQGQAAEALEHVAKAKAVYLKIVDLSRIEGVALCGVGQYEAALAAFRKDYDLFSRAAWSRVHEAWVLTTAPDEKLRDGKKALELLKAVRSQLGNSMNAWSIHVTEAVVAAENGNFEEAREFARLGEEAADTDSRREIAKRVRAVLDQDRPYRMPESGEIPPPPAGVSRAKRSTPPPRPESTESQPETGT
ncbi:hypothetical protein Pan44_41030 [Caulifigura coniformis]|uniref:Tetratricopeptide repeat protein n=1 Tax=Caulifigura coniformis TaxID=2527983 RepID=A0A517SIT6_9PLAN|nr:hypothetical protein [Caulifigura coniformis]QDT56053.1 hypothetical protein Pan44_41030 [Caulifigura coniformis]